MRGRKCFHDLSEADQFIFANWMEETLTTYDAFLINQNSNILRPGEGFRAGRGAFRQFFAHPGAVEWFEQSGMETRWPSHLVDAIREAIEFNRNAPA